MYLFLLVGVDLDWSLKPITTTLEERFPRTREIDGPPTVADMLVPTEEGNRAREKGVTMAH